LYRKAYRKKNKKHLRAYRLGYDSRNRKHLAAKHKVYVKSWYKRNRARLLAEKKVYNQAPKRRKYALVQNKKRYYANRASILAKMKSDARTPKGKARIRHQKAVRKVRGLTQAYTAYHTALSYGAPGHFTGAQFISLCFKYGNPCLCCHRKRSLTPDHVIPFSKGGTNYISNIQPLCLSCNLKKFNRTTDYR
jgi:5-methylcytosine-specific restriction endonuclease McrA